MPSRTEPRTGTARKTYEKPSLKTYGRLKDLTTGGSNGPFEGASSSKNKVRP